VDNSFNGKIKYFDGQQIATLKSGDEHGYGLKNIKQSVEKYNGYMRTTHTDTVFLQAYFFMWMMCKHPSLRDFVPSF